MTRYLALNPAVLKELKSNRTLYLLWTCGHRIDMVDPDIDPTHNPLWVEKRKHHELDILEQIKEDITNAVLKQWDDWE